MTDRERVEMIGVLEIVTAYPYIYLKKLTDEELIKLHKERFENRG